MATKPKKPPPTPPEAEEEEDGADDAEPKYVTVEQLNKALSKGIGQFARKTLPKLLEGSLAGALAKAGIGPKDPDGDDDDDAEEGEAGEGAAKPDKPEKPGKPAKPAETPPGRTKADKELAKLRREMEEMKAKQVADAEKTARDQERNTVRTALEGSGVKKEMVGPLTAWLLGDDSGKMVRRDGDGKIVFVTGEGDDIEETPLKDGLAGWLKSDAGKGYVAPKQAAGGGFQPPRQNGGAPAPRGPANAANALAQRDAADAELFQAVTDLVGTGGVPAQQ